MDSLVSLGFLQKTSRDRAQMLTTLDAKPATGPCKLRDPFLGLKFP